MPGLVVIAHAAGDIAQGILGAKFTVAIPKLSDQGQALFQLLEGKLPILFFKGAKIAHCRQGKRFFSTHLFFGFFGAVQQRFDFFERLLNRFDLAQVAKKTRVPGERFG